MLLVIVVDIRPLSGERMNKRMSVHNAPHIDRATITLTGHNVVYFSIGNLTEPWNSTTVHTLDLVLCSAHCSAGSSAPTPSVVTDA